MEDFTKLSAFAGMPAKQEDNSMNYLKFPKIKWSFTDKNVEIYNAQVNYFKEIGLPQIKRTKSGGIALSSIGYGWDSRKLGNSMMELTVSTWYTNYRLILTNTVDEDGDASKMSGCTAFIIMRGEFKKDGIKLADYAVKNGLKIKEEEIEKLMIFPTEELEFGKTYENIHHLDFHSSFPGGLANTHPELRPTIERVYAKRKASVDGSKLKLALDASIGYFQSEYCKINNCRYALANLSRDAINDNNARIRRATDELRASGRVPLLYNTDGIWYAGDLLETGTDYGPGVGKWENDHTALKFRVKSRGAYEYIDSDGYHPVVRGRSKLDETKSRDKWEWGDIFNIGGIKQFVMNDGGNIVGVYIDEEQLLW